MTIENKVSHVELRSIKKMYDKRPVLDNISFQIDRGTVFGYIGPNGAGKTTTMKIIVGLIQNYDGSVLINGLDTKKDNKEFHKSLGYLPQESGFQQWRTVDHALKTFGNLSGLNSDSLEARIQK
ncbi:MAG: ATP-binding cassette domain-containing protein [Candidatus Lokiarchaeota archaeon]|nr:ATP-binding cassette domain-containing protein [Candidatus Lokiarchaeota archaeon]